MVDGLSARATALTSLASFLLYNVRGEAMEGSTRTDLTSQMPRITSGAASRKTTSEHNVY
jgi:hypothetical protein